MARQRSHSIEFKRQVAQEFIAGETLYALAKRHDLSRTIARTPVRSVFARIFSTRNSCHWWLTGERKFSDVRFTPKSRHSSQALPARWTPRSSSRCKTPGTAANVVFRRSQEAFHLGNPG